MRVELSGSQHLRSEFFRRLADAFVQCNRQVEVAVSPAKNLGNFHLPTEVGSGGVIVNERPPTQTQYETLNCSLLTILLGANFSQFNYIIRNNISLQCKKPHLVFFVLVFLFLWWKISPSIHLLHYCQPYFWQRRSWKVWDQSDPWHWCLLHVWSVELLHPDVPGR